MRLFILLICCLLCCRQGFTQTEGRQKFEQAFALHMDRMIDLYKFRGVPDHFDCYRDRIDGERTEPIPAIRQFLSRWAGLSKPPVLVFYHLNNDTMFSWLFSLDTILYHEKRLQRDSLLQAELDLREVYSVRVAGETTVRGKRKIYRRNRGRNIGLGQGVASGVNFAEDRLSRWLFPESFRASLQKAGHLFVIPELNIGQIPLWTLRPFGNKEMLVDVMSYSLVPNVCGFTGWQELTEHAPLKMAIKFKNPLIAGNPKFPKSAGLSPLPGAEEEAEQVAGILNAPAIIGKEATCETIRNRFSDADLIYLATHAYSSPVFILDSSWVAFTPDKNNASGKWYLRDIQHSYTRAELAVLSACQTGYGKVLEGGVVGLGRAFMKAGTRFTVMSLWQVDDRSTSFLMTSFMNHLGKPYAFSPGEPLRQAMLETRKLYPDPARWAPFILFGFTY